MQLHAGLDRNDQYSRNLSDAAGLARQRRQRAHVGRDAAADGSTTSCAGVERVARRQRTRRASRPQIDSIRQTLIGVANTQYAGRPIFGGHRDRRRRPTTPTGSTSASRSPVERNDRARAADPGERQRRHRVRNARETTCSPRSPRSRTRCATTRASCDALQTTLGAQDQPRSRPRSRRSDRNFFAFKTCRAKTLRMR